MQITEIRLIPSYPGEKVLARASVIFDSMLAVHGISIERGRKGLRVRYPVHFSKGGQRRHTAHPINEEARIYMDQSILKAYENRP